MTQAEHVVLALNTALSAGSFLMLLGILILVKKMYYEK